MKNIKQIIPLQTIKNSILDGLLTQIVNSSEGAKMQEGELYNIKLSLTSGEIRKNYMLGTLPDNDLVQDFDLFQKREVITSIRIKDFKIESVSIENIY